MIVCLVIEGLAEEIFFGFYFLDPYAAFFIPKIGE